MTVTPHKTIIFLILLCIGNYPVMAKPDCGPEPSVHCGKTPSSVFGNNERLWVVFEYRDRVYLSHSDDAGKSFSATIAVNTEPESIYTNGENRPKIALGPNGGIYVSWTQKTNGQYTGDIRFSRSLDNGKTFSSVKTINDDGLLTSHRFDSLHINNKGHIYLVWLDKRDQVYTKREEGASPGKPYHGAAVYYSVSTDNGKTFSKNRKVIDHSCECCRIAISAYKEEGAAIFWRHIFGENIRDHAFALLTANNVKTGSFQRATYDNWQIDACPHHGPSMTPGDQESYHMTWFTNGNDRKGIYYGHFKTDKTSMENITPVTDSPSASHPYIHSTQTHLVLVWKQFDGEKTLIQAVTADRHSKPIVWSQTRTLADTTGASDHPLLIQNKETVYLSWHTQQEGLRLIPVALPDTNAANESPGPISKLKPFTTKSDIRSIETAYKGKSFLLVLWSADCEPCRDELELLGQLKQKHPGMNLVLISTDNIDRQSTVIQNLLSKHQLTHADNWAFADDNIERLRYSIDPQWFGELPRSYLYDDTHKRNAVSGKLNRQTILDFIND